MVVCIQLIQLVIRDLQDPLSLVKPVLEPVIVRLSLITQPRDPRILIVAAQ